MQPISLCMISRGEKTLAAAIRSALPLVAEVIVVCDPKDRVAVDAAVSGLDVRVIERVWDANFSRQRQAGFDAATHPWALWADSDDLLVGADRLAAYLKDQPDEPSQIFMQYQYHANCVQTRERIVWRAAGCWADRAGDPLEIHELWMPRADQDVRTVTIPREVAYVEHQVANENPDERKAKHIRNRVALEAHMRRRKAEGVPPDRRLVSHYVDQLISDGDYERSVEIISRFAPEEPHGWCRHRLYMQAAQAYYRLKDYKTGASFATLAFAECPLSAEARCSLIELSLAEDRYDEALYWFRSSYEEGLDLAYDPVGFDPRLVPPPYGLAAKACMGLNDFVKAARYAAKMGDRDQARFLQEEVRVMQAAYGAALCMDLHEEISGYYIPDGEWRKKFCLQLPRPVQDYPEIAAWLLPEIPAGVQTVVIHCGSEGGGMTDTWGPDSLGKGIGGSEEAVLRVAPELVKAGCHVEVYGPWPKDEVRDGVHYIFHAKWNPDRQVDVFVAWRYEGLAAIGRAAKKRVLWLHDQVPPGAKFRGFDEVWCLSQSHADLTKKHNPGVPPIWVTRNGIPSDIAEEVTQQQSLAALLELPDMKEPGRVIWASSPDRGLDILLEMWPAVREAIPGATLDVFYGFPASYLRAEASRPELVVLRQKIEGLLESLRDSGVNYEGMVGADRLHRAFAEAEVWAYPTHWPETSCITAMKAQALGAMPVTVPLTALGETVVWGRLLPLGGPDMQAAWDEKDRLCYQEALIGALKTPWADRGWTPDLATRFGWDGVAREWAAHMKELTDGHDPRTTGPGRDSESGHGPGEPRHPARERGADPAVAGEPPTLARPDGADDGPPADGAAHAGDCRHAAAR